MRLTNKEIDQAKGEHEERLTVMDGQLGNLKGRLRKLYDAVETGKLEVEDVGPRIKELRTQIDEQKEKRLDLVESIQDAKVELLKASVVGAYVDDLKALLSKGSIMERKSFLRSLIKRIEVALPEIAIEYTVPVGRKRAEPLTREALPFEYSGFAAVSELSWLREAGSQCGKGALPIWLSGYATCSP